MSMNYLTKVRKIQQMNDLELESNLVGSSSSWHMTYKESNWIYIGALPYELSEGDVLCVFSQYGVPQEFDLIRDKDTGKSKGFGFLRYDDFRSCILAVDNLNGAKIVGRPIHVDHSLPNKARDKKEEIKRKEHQEAQEMKEISRHSSSRQRDEKRSKRR